MVGETLSSGVPMERRVLAPLLDPLSALASLPLGDLSEGALRLALVDGEAVGSAVRALQARLLAEASRRGLDRTDGCASPAAWLSTQVGISAAEASRRQQEARIVEASPAVADAFATGRITAEHVRHIATVTAHEPGLPVEELLAHARTTDAGRFASRARQLRRAHQGDGGLSQYESQRRARRCSLHVRPEDGLVVLHAELDPLDGARVRAALFATVERLWRAEDPNHGGDAPPLVTGNAERMADALVQLCTRSGDDRQTADGVDDVAVFVSIGYESLTGRPVGRSPAGDGCDNDTGVRNLPGHDIGVGGGHEDESGYGRRAPDAGAGGIAEVIGVGPIPAATVRRLACEARIIPVVLGGRGEILDLGRSRRLASRAQRRALRHQHGRCAWPGCTIPFEWCQIHHRRPWEQGGRTDVAELLPLCNAHHHLAHEGGWAIERAPTTGFRFVRPDGTVLDGPARERGLRRLPETPAGDRSSQPAPAEHGPRDTNRLHQEDAREAVRR